MWAGKKLHDTCCGRCKTVGISWAKPKMAQYLCKRWWCKANNRDWNHDLEAEAPAFWVLLLIQIMCLWSTDQVGVKYLQVFVIVFLFWCSWIKLFMVTFRVHRERTSKIFRYFEQFPIKMFWPELPVLIQKKAEENLWVKGRVGSLWLLSYRFVWMIYIFTEWKGRGKRKQCFASGYFFSIPKELFCYDISHKFSSERKYIFSSWCTKLCIQARALDFGPVWAN